jgi:hypothetical protein
LDRGRKRRRDMGPAIWDKARALEFPDMKCEYCGRPLSVGDEYYILNGNLSRFGHADCVWKAVDEEAKKQGV